MVLSQLPAQTVAQNENGWWYIKNGKLILTTTVLHKTKMAGGIFVTVS